MIDETTMPQGAAACLQPVEDAAHALLDRGAHPGPSDIGRDCAGRGTGEARLEAVAREAGGGTLSSTERSVIDG